MIVNTFTKLLDAVVFPVIVFACTAIIGKIINGAYRRTKKLTNHYFFYRIRNLININIKTNFMLQNKVKENIFKDILVSQLTIFEKEFYELANDIDENHKKYNDDTVLIETVSSTLNKIEERIYNFYLYENSLSECDIKTLKVVMRKYRKWNSRRIERTIEIIETICSLSFYDTPEEKMCALLDSLMIIIIEMLDDAQKTLGSLNGDLKGLTYKGEII